MIKVKILGCGASLGTPVIGCQCNVCNSDNIFNRRTRSAILLQDDTSNILIDSGYDIRNQLLREDIKKIDYVILTHPHSDHIGGLDDLRIFYYKEQNSLEIFADQITANIIYKNFDYLFHSKKMKLNILEIEKNLKLSNMNFSFFKHNHGSIENISIKIENFLYSCDVSEFKNNSEKKLINLDHWVIDCVDYKGTKAHIGLEHILELNAKFKPKKVYLTGLSHKIDYQEISTKIPSNFVVLYDGYQLLIDQ